MECSKLFYRAREKFIQFTIELGSFKRWTWKVQAWKSTATGPIRVGKCKYDTQKESRWLRALFPSQLYLFLIGRSRHASCRASCTCLLLAEVGMRLAEPVVLVYYWPKSACVLPSQLYLFIIGRSLHASCPVPRPHYCKRPMRFVSRSPSENPSFLSRIRHRNTLTKKAWEEAVLGRARHASKLKGKRFLVCFCFFFLTQV